MKKLIQYLYGIYIILSMDMVLEKPVLNLYTYYTIIYAVILTILFLYINQCKIKKRDYKVVKPLLLLLVLVIFSMTRSLTNNMTCVKMICLITILICNYFFFKKYGLSKKILEYSFYIPSLFIAWRFVIEGAPFDVYTKLNMLFGAEWNERYRVTFGTYHPNAIGNLACCVIMLSFIILSENNIRTMDGKGKRVCICLFDFINVTVLLSSDSRSSILAIVVCLVVFFFFRTTEINNKMLKVISRSLLVCIGVSAFVITQSDNVTNLFVSSNRYANFAENLPYLNTFFRKIFGLGLIDASDFGTGLTGLGNTFYVDNYFLYIIFYYFCICVFFYSSCYYCYHYCIMYSYS